ncbi:MAG: hypothetical protein ACYCST_11250 [Acidimicrobiales bacterium]
MTLYVITDADGSVIDEETGEANPRARWPFPRKTAGGWDTGRCVSSNTPRHRRHPWTLYPVESLSAAASVGILWEAEGCDGLIRGGDLARYASARLLRTVGEITHSLLVTAMCDWVEHARQGPMPAESRNAIGAARAWASCPCGRHSVQSAAAVAAVVGGLRDCAALYCVEAVDACSDWDVGRAARGAVCAIDSAGCDYDAIYADYDHDTSCADVITDCDLDTRCSAADAERLWQGQRLIEIVSRQ